MYTLAPTVEIIFSPNCLTMLAGPGPDHCNLNLGLMECKNWFWVALKLIAAGLSTVAVVAAAASEVPVVEVEVEVEVADSVPLLVLVPLVDDAFILAPSVAPVAPVALDCVFTL